ncbi:MAG: hypothetical protein E7568_03910 [Ruminococcaceae bacterium]|nr:hypothetical protein [Oscillospiraceae bacterium]
MNGFNVNTEIDIPKVKRKIKPIKRLLRNPFIKLGTVFLCAIIVVLLFLLIVPLKTVRFLDSRTAIDTEGNREIVYYDKNGRIEKTENYHMNELNNLNKYFYNKDGNLERIENYYFDSLTQTENYIYTKGLLTEKNAKDIKGNIISKSLNIYTEGILELTTEYDYEGKPYSEIRYVFDKDVLVSKTQTTLQNDYIVTTDYTYDKGKLVKEKITTSSGTSKEIIYTYNRLGDMLTKYEEGSNYITYTYSYTDKKVNVFYKG